MRCQNRASKVAGASRQSLALILGLIIGLLATTGGRAAQSVTLAWDANSATNVAGYHLYYGTTSGDYDSSVTVSYPAVSATVVDVRPGTTYYFAVAAYNVDDLEGELSDEVTYSVPGIQTNTPPVANAGRVVTSEDQSVAITLSGSDANGDRLTYTVASTPVNGVLNGTAPNLVYTPNADSSGADSLSFRVNDGRIDSVEATVVIVVNPVNDAPTLAPLSSVSFPLNSTTQTVPLTGIGSGSAFENQGLIVTATSSNPLLIPQPTVVYTSPNSTGSLRLAPVANASGNATITVTVDDGQAQNNTVRQIFTVTVTAGNLRPTLVPLANRTISEDAGPQTISLSGIGSGSVNESQPLVVTATSSATWLIPNPSVTYTSPNSTGVLSFAPAINVNGTATITVIVNDGQAQNNSVTQAFQVVVTPVNDAPRLAALNNLSIQENAGSQTVSLSGIGTGSANESQTLVVTATSSNPGLIPQPTVNYASPNAVGSLTFAPLANASGNAMISVVVNDGQSQNATTRRDFMVTVVPDNEPPTLAAIGDRTLLEDAATQTVALNGISTGSQTENQTLTITAVSSNPGLIPNPVVSYISPNSSGSLSFTPIVNANGTARITVTVNDGGDRNSFSSRDFLVTVTSVNDAPRLNALGNLMLNENAGLQTVNLTGIGTGSANEVQELLVTATSDNPGLIPHPAVNYTDPSATGSLAFTPVSNASGSALITVVVDDGQAQNNRTTRTFTVTVNPDNHPPTLAEMLDVSINEDTPSQTVNLLGIGSGSAGENQRLTVTATSSNPGLIPDPVVTYTSPSASGTLRFSPNVNVNGTAILSVTVDDGQLRDNTVTRTFRVTVNPVNDAPRLASLTDIVILENSGTHLVALAGIATGSANEVDTLSVTAISSNTRLIPNPTVVYTSPQATGSLSFAPLADATGVTTITVMVDDGQPENSTAIQTFTVTVAAANRAPTISTFADVVLNEDAPQKLVNFSTVSPGGNREVQTLTITAVSSNPSLIPHPTVRYESPNSGGYLTFTPAPGGFGTAQVTVTVDDGQQFNHATVRTFQVTVNSVNDQPTVGYIDDAELFEDGGGVVIRLAGITSGAANEDQTLVVTATSSNPNVIPHPVVSYRSPDSTGTITVTPVTNGIGSATISVTVNDGGASQATAVRTFYVAVRGINDAPTMTPIGDQVIGANESSGLLRFTVYDPDTSLDSVAVRAISSNVSLLPNSSFVFGGSGAERSLTITPPANASGSVQVTLSCTDGYGTNYQTIRVTVGSLNRAPVISAIPDQELETGAAMANVPFQISDPETSATALTVTATSLNPTLVPDANISLGGSGGSRNISLTPIAGRTGEATIGVRVSDGTRLAQSWFTVTVRSARATLTVNKYGRGRVTPDLNGQALTLGATYTITAVPEPGYVFASWGGDVTSTSRILAFVMRLGMVIEANFEPDPFVAMQGTYNGLIAEAEEVRHDRSGNFTLTANARGSYSGKLQVGRNKFVLRGQLALDGRATNSVLRPTESPLTVVLALNTGDQAGQMSGRVVDQSWTALMQGDRQAFHSRTNPAPYAGSYTMALPADEASPAGPTGVGHGTITVDGNGVAKFVGTLADGTKATQVVPLTRDGQWPFYLALYQGAGSALGWLTFDQDEGQLNGLVSWIKPRTQTKYFWRGFTNESSVLGSRYVAPTANDLRAASARSTEVRCSGGNLSEEVSVELMVLPNGKVAPPGHRNLKFGLTPTTGLFKGTVFDPATGKPRSFSGVILQKWAVGGGIVLGVDDVGAVELVQP